MLGTPITAGLVVCETASTLRGRYHRWQGALLRNTRQQHTLPPFTTTAIIGAKVPIFGGLVCFVYLCANDQQNTRKNGYFVAILLLFICRIALVAEN